MFNERDNFFHRTSERGFHFQTQRSRSTYCSPAGGVACNAALIFAPTPCKSLRRTQPYFAAMPGCSVSSWETRANRAIAIASASACFKSTLPVVACWRATLSSKVSALAATFGSSCLRFMFGCADRASSVPDTQKSALATPRAPKGASIERVYAKTFSLNILPALNAGTVVAGILIGLPVPGLRPSRACRCRGSNVPNPTSVTLSPFATVSVITSRAAVSTVSASFLVMFAFDTIASISSPLFIRIPQSVAGIVTWDFTVKTSQPDKFCIVVAVRCQQPIKGGIDVHSTDDRRVADDTNAAGKANAVRHLNGVVRTEIESEGAHS